ncbi:MAG: prenyltransferase [Desulfobacterales bacterium]|jgi:1,4-dihydroxy-2-naphthoate octaprenyltransferase
MTAMAIGFKQLLGPMRVPFLLLTPACFLLGLGTASLAVDRVNAVQAVLVLIGAVSAHISVNAFNEYVDFKSGLDFKTCRTPFSGGSGTLPENPALAGTALKTAQITFSIAALIGLYFCWARGWRLLPLGILGLVVIYAYTAWLVCHPLLCLVAPGLGFGPLMVMGTHFALTGEYSTTSGLASLIPFFLVSDLLLLNQFPDVEADRSIGRRHLPVVVGRRFSSYIYGLFLLCAYLVLVIGVCNTYFPPACLIGLITAAVALPAFLGAVRFADRPQKLIPFMGLNVIVNLTMPVLIAVGMLAA